MNSKRFAAFAALAGLLVTAAPGFAATTKTGTITVKWNTQLVASLTLHTDYSATGLFNGGTAAGSILANVNGGLGACTATDPTNTDLTVDFGNVTPDGAQYTDCMYKNAVNAAVTTNSTNWTLAEKATAGYPASGFLVCLLPNGTYGAAGAVTQTVRAAAPSIVSTTTCGAGNDNMDATGATLYTGTAAANNSNYGGDIELVMAPNAPSGAQSVTETYTLVAN